MGDKGGIGKLMIESGMDGRTYGRTDGRTNGQFCGRMNGRMNERMDGRIDEEGTFITARNIDNGKTVF